MCVRVSVYVFVRMQAHTTCQTISSMGLINSLHHHHKGTLLVTVAEFYVHTAAAALAPIANFFMAFEQRLQ